MSNERSHIRNLASEYQARAEYFSAWPYARWPGAPGLNSKPKSAVDGSQQLMFVPSPASNPIPGSWPGEQPGDREDLNARIQNSKDYWAAGDVWFAMNNPATPHVANRNLSSSEDQTTEDVQEPPEGSGYDAYFSYANKLAPALNELLFGKDPEERAAILRSKIVSFESVLAKTKSATLRMLIQGKIDSYKAQLVAVEKQASESSAARQANLTLRFMAIGGAGLGLILLLQVSNYLRKKTAKI